MGCAELQRRLVKTADVLVENFRPGVMARLGLGCDDLKQINPRLAYCAISGFDQSVPLKNAPVCDQIVQGLSGVMSIAGSEESAPRRVGYPVAESIDGLTCAETDSKRKRGALATLLEKRTQLLRTRRMAQLGHGLHLDLADALARYFKLLADFLERMVAGGVEAKAQAQDLLLLG